MAKRQIIERVKCIRCRIGLLLRWDNNPVIVVCRHLQTKDVACVPRECQYYKESKFAPDIRILTHYPSDDK